MACCCVSRAQGARDVADAEERISRAVSVKLFHRPEHAESKYLVNGNNAVGAGMAQHPNLGMADNILQSAGLQMSTANYVHTL
jgi:hypothetical protein